MALVYMGSDHAGFGLRGLIARHLRENGHEVRDLGPDSPESCDYPVFARKVCEKVLEDAGSFGILVCGTGVGMSMAANRFPGIRAALCVGERVTGPGVALGMVDLFLSTPFEGGRHQRRIDLFDAAPRA